ncbi:MAG TPA: NAD-dependent deacylase [Candidatus Nitrosocosmicus sp.]|nr:NAD-dependent deacylase [Candidatus Nitrosocosmicus sp.]
MAFNADSLAQLRDILVKSKRFVFLTGAGISQESKIPTFRGNDGLWKTHDPAKLATLSSFLENPSLVWGFYSYRQKLISKCRPNPAHLAISKIEEQKKGDSWVLTQNVDNLHRLAGSKNIIELHGNIFKLSCIICGYSGYMDMDVDMVLPPKCTGCESVLKPGVVMFEEALPQKEWGTAIELSSSCDLMFIVGTSLNVSPVNTLPSYAKDNNAVLVEVNPEETWLSRFMDFSIKGSSADVLPNIYNLMR